MCENVCDHPEYRSDKNQKFDHIRRAVTDIGKDKHRYRDRDNAEIRNTFFVGFCKDLRQHVHLRHALSDICQSVDTGVLRTDDSKCGNQCHPDFTGFAKEKFSVEHMRCGRVCKIVPWCVMVESEHHDRLHDQNDDESERHTERHVFLGIFYLTGDRDCKFCTDKKPECYRCHGDDLRRAGCHIGGLRNNLSGSELEDTDEPHNDHGAYKKKCNEILQLGKHIHAI